MMTDGEICREYRLAKDKDKQIGIIADQCGMERDEIVKVLVDCGEMKAPVKKTKAESKPAKKNDGPVVPAVVLEIIYHRMDELDKKIKPLEDELKPLRKEYEQIAGFLQGCGR